MVTWWTALSGTEHFFFIIAIGSTFILALQLVMNMIGLAGHDTDFGTALPHDIGAGSLEHPDLAAHSTGLGLISVRTVIAFFVGFGWAGFALLGMEIPITISVILSLVIGFGFMMLVFYLMKTIFKLSDAGNIDNRNAIGQTGTVYIPIPAGAKGVGQVQVVVEGRMRELAAVTEGVDSLPTGTPIKIVKMMGTSTSTAVVQKLV